ncbi:MAG: hypothetical protein BWY31_04384 [Lentisphaerae bacterium ADurb.Bin242]|nr:MAG: hypothetical protein BWY31_04384 [Lentisphaerae bacterium ADurb.Bin242]
MKKNSLIQAAILVSFGLCATEHPITPVKNTENPGSFYVASQVKTGVTCIKNEDGRYIFRIDAKDDLKKLISGTRIKIEQGDTMTLKLKLKVRAKASLGTGFYIYSGKIKYITALYTPDMELTPEKTDYTFTGVVQKNPGEASAFDRPAVGIIFFDAKKGCDFDIEKIEFEVKHAPAEKVTIPEF